MGRCKFFSTKFFYPTHSLLALFLFLLIQPISKRKKRKANTFQPNPHPNSKFSSYPSHELEIAYLFQNFPFQTPTPPEISKQLASAFLNFAYDKPSSRAFQRLEAVKAHFEPSPQNKNEPEILYISPSQGVTRIPTHTWDAVYNHGREELWNLIPTGKWHMLGDLMQNSGY